MAMTLGKKRLGEFKKMLQVRLAELLNEADRTVKDISDAEGEAPSDPTDQAVQELDRSRLLRFKDRERKLIRKIEKALARIEDGTYGLCESCGATIAEARLLARPVASLCIDCATEIESEEAKHKFLETKVVEDYSNTPTEEVAQEASAP